MSSAIRAACEAGMTMRDGMPLHAALVEKDGYGVVFLGPSGMGKSTQAKLWVEHPGADFIIGDRPGLRRIDSQWIGFGMPWDGKDGIRQQKQVPIRALISLEQAPENSIRRLTKQEAMMVLLNQVMMPMWDDTAMALLTPLMGQLATEIPFYHLKNLPNKEATELTHKTICETCL
jgi:serine kinase of HPr protein (carbohydrate metabolism regulator)